MFYAFIFQDDLLFCFIDEDAMVNLAEAISHYEWGEFESWLDAHHDLLIQRHEVKASDTSIGGGHSLV